MRQNLIDRLRSESTSEHVAYTEFITSYKKNSDVLYCFFEGKEDKRYYNIRIEQTTLKKIKSFTCYGKDKVIATYNLINQRKEYSNVKILYFIDKDFDFSKSILEDIYRTPYYSIENFYCGQKTIEKVLEAEFDLSRDDNNFKIIMKIFKKLQSSFHKDILLLNSWLACQYDIRKKQKNKTYLHIDDKLDKYFKNIVNDNLSSISNFQELKDHNFIETVLFPEAPKVSKKILNRKIARFKKIEGYKYFRGKFEIKFIISFLFRLQSEIGKKNSAVFSKKCSCNLRFEYSTSISLLSQYSETPSSLNHYLNNFRKAI